MSTRSGGTVTKQVNQVDEKTIDLIAMLFDAITDDLSISDVMTNLLLRMQTPVIKVAMLDQAFFTSGNHTARSVLNLIAQLGKGINQKDDPLYIQLEAIVDEILTKFDVDVISFQQAVDQLNALLNNEQEKTEETEKQTRKMVLQAHARQVVLQELQYRIKAFELPRVVYSLIFKHWSTLMFHRYIREGKNSDSWNQAVTILGQLLLCLQAPVKQQWFALKSQQLELIDVIRQQLYATRQNRLEIDVVIDHLMHAFQQVLDQKRFNDNIDDESELGLDPAQDKLHFIADHSAFDHALSYVISSLAAAS